MSLAEALAAHAAGRPGEALARLQAMGPAAADDALALQLWSVLLPSDRSGDALALLERAVRIAPGDAQAHFNLAVTLQGAGLLDRAVLHYQQSLTLDPGLPGALNNLSDLHRRRGRVEEGRGLLERYRALGGDMTGIEIRAAKLALDTQRHDEAERWFAAAAAHAPDDAKVAWEHAMLTLAREDWARGWPQYEARLAAYTPAALGIYPHPEPRWQGGDVAGRRLLLHREQGLGDMMMFASALPGLVAEGAALHLALHPPLARLFAASFPEARVWSSTTHVGAAEQPHQPWREVAGAIDLQAPVGSLGALRMPQGPPAPLPYLRAPAADAARWAERLDALAPVPPGGLRAGLVLGARLPRFSDDGMTNGIRKSVPPAEAAVLAEATRVRWVALHDRESAPMLADVPGLAFADTSPWLTDLADTAAAIANLDLVVSVDTAVAHLAGAMGKPVLLMLWKGADWRWGIGRERAIWYPDMRLFRQPAAGDWRSVLGEVVRALA